MRPAGEATPSAVRVTAEYDDCAEMLCGYARELYWLVAMGRSVHALDRWYEAGSQRHQRRGTEPAEEIDDCLS
jgi:hypothetical protein